jgi:hypothetical protein
MPPPDFRCLGTWMLSAGGIPIPTVPHGAARSTTIHRHYYEVLTPEEHNDPLWDPNNEDQWTTFFMERRNQELAHYEGNGPPPTTGTPPRRSYGGASLAASSPSSSTTSPWATTRG